MDECKRFQEQLGEFLLGGLSASDRAAFEHHLGQCPTCSRELAATRRALAAVDRAGLGSTPAGVAEAVAAGVAARLRGGLRPYPHFRWVRAVAAAAACLALGVLGIWVTTRRPGTPTTAQMTNEQLDVEARAVEAHAMSVLRQLGELGQEFDAVSRMTGGGPGPGKGNERTEGPGIAGNPRRAKS